MYLVPLDGKIPLGQSIFSQKGKDDEVDEALRTLLSVGESSAGQCFVIDYYKVASDDDKIIAHFVAPSGE